VLRNRENRSDRPFFIYYGLGTPEARDRLRNESLIIVELRQWKPSDLLSLREGGTRIYGYMSIMESPSWNDSRIGQLIDHDYLLQDGHRVHFDKWNSFLMDMRSPSYRRLLLNEWEEMQSGWPIDGIFLDTVGDIEEFVTPSLRQEMGHAYRAFLSVAATRFPQLQTIQNRGFTQLESCVSLLDGLLWEDWRADWIHDPYASRWVSLLRTLKKERTLSVYTASSSSSSAMPEHRKSAHKLGFLHRYIDPGYLLLPES
jgi:polysaccharide biosynthesis protein PelA